MLDNYCYSRRPAPVTRANGDQTPGLIGTIQGKTRLRVRACLWLFSGRPGGFAGVVRAHLRGPAREGEGHYFLIHGEGSV